MGLPNKGQPMRSSWIILEAFRTFRNLPKPSQNFPELFQNLPEPFPDIPRSSETISGPSETIRNTSKVIRINLDTSGTIPELSLLP